jgi:predicted esterase
MLASDKNSVYSLIEANMLNTSDFINALEEATIVEYGKIAKNPIFVFSLKHDSIVPMNNTQKFVSEANKISNNNVTSYFFDNMNHKVCDGLLHPPVDHLRAESLSNIFAINFINKV